MSRATARRTPPLVAFSWGYEGWGNHTEDLIEVVDAVEKSRGFLPPIFVDVRIRRQVRAIGFRERAFEERLGKKRYRWLRGLGNRAIVEESDEDIVIDDPSQANELLDCVLDAARERRRIVFFCSCGSPMHAADCHRAEVARLLIRTAQRRKAVLTVHEWPGGSPISSSIRIAADVMKKLAAGNLGHLPLPEDVRPSRAAALPHLSLLAPDNDSALLVVTGPARRSARGWALPVHNVANAAERPRLLKQLAEDLREMNLAPRGARLELPVAWRTESLVVNT